MNPEIPDDPSTSTLSVSPNKIQTIQTAPVEEPKPFLLIPADITSILSGIVMELRSLNAEAQKYRGSLTEISTALTKVSAELSNANALERDKIQFSQLKDKMMAHLNKMIQKARETPKEEHEHPAAQ
jgi:cob(I)alamin adenosyltransferase